MLGAIKMYGIYSPLLNVQYNKYWWGIMINYNHMNGFFFYILQANMMIERICIYLGEKSMKIVKKCASKA